MVAILTGTNRLRATNNDDASKLAAGTKALKKKNQTKPEQWKTSISKDVLSRLLRDETSWVNGIINEDPTFGVKRSRSTSKTIRKIHESNELFHQYKINNFISNFKSLKCSIEKETLNVDFDQKAYEKEKLKYPMQEMFKVGYARWNHPNNRVTRELLAKDTKQGGVYHVKNLN